MAKTLFIEIPDHFSFANTIRSHGWYDLAPFELDEVRDSLTYVFAGADGEPFPATVSEDSGRLKVSFGGTASDKRTWARR